MTAPSVPVLHSFARLRRRFARAPGATLIELACRAGYLARGLVYLSISVIALLAAAGRTPDAEGAVEAMEALGRWPLGQALLTLAGFGLIGFAGWRGLQAVLDADRRGREPKALATRAGKLMSGLAHAGLAVSVFGLLDTVGDLQDVDDEANTRQAVERALDWPGGAWLVVLAGVFMLGVAAGNLWRARRGDFAKRMVCSERMCDVAEVLGVSGYLARGIAFLPVGVALVQAGWSVQSSEARGLGGALEALKEGPLGGPVLALIALGLGAFGLFAFVQARFRTIRAEEALDKAG